MKTRVSPHIGLVLGQLTGSLALAAELPTSAAELPLAALQFLRMTMNHGPLALTDVRVGSTPRLTFVNGSRSFVVEGAPLERNISELVRDLVHALR